MTDRIKGLTVTLEADIREPDSQPIIDAICLIDGVVDVATHVADIDDHMAHARARHDIYLQLIGILKP